ncbi:MAG: AraC family transcriptional regulator [Thermoanaerobacteraceae bacterium]
MIEYRKTTEPFNMPSEQYHDAYEIYYLVSGERYYFIKDKVYHVMSGDLIFININDIHKTSGLKNPNHERILVHFKPEFLNEFLVSAKNLSLLSVFERDINAIRLNINEQQNIERLLYRMLDEYQTKKFGWEFSLKILLLDLLIFMKRQCENSSINFFQYPNALHEKISQIALFMNANFYESITLDIISKKFNISPWYFSRSFKEITGFTFSEYLNRIRIKEAQHLLKNSDLSIEEITGKVGFDSSTHFGRTFKSLVGISPLKYRKSKREQKF